MLDVEVPEPPELVTGMDVSEYDDVEVVGDEYRREELSQYLEDGAWREAFLEWASETEVTEETWKVVIDLELIPRFDFFWDSFAQRVGFHAPGIQQDWKERRLHPELTSWGQVSAINAGLTEFGQLVCDILKDDYIEWEDEYEAPDDLPDFEK